MDDVIAALQGSWSLVSLEGVPLPANAKLTLRIAHRAKTADPSRFDCLLDLTKVPSPEEDRRPQTLRAAATLELVEGLHDGEVQLDFGKGFSVVFQRGSNIGSNAFPIKTLGNDTLVVGPMSFERAPGGGEDGSGGMSITFCDQRLDPLVTTVICDDGSAPAVDLAALSELRELQTLEVRLNGGTVNGASTLSRFTRLKSLSIREAQFSDISGLRATPQLERVTLEHTQVADLAALTELTQLRVLDLSNTNVVDLRPLAHLTTLRELDLSNIPATDISPLGGLAELRRLDLLNTNFTRAEPLYKLRKLEDLFAVSAHLVGVLPERELARLEAFEQSIRARSR